MAAMVASLLALSVVLSQTPAPELKLAAPGLEAVDIDPKKARFLNDLIAEQLGKRTDGRIRVTTEAEVGALLGLERQKQLLGCSDQSSCLAEISGALGVDGLIVGNVARFGETYAMTVRVISARDATPMASASTTGMKEEALVEWVKTAAWDLAIKLDPGTHGRSRPAGPGQAPVADGATLQDRLHHNSIRVSILGVEYNRRLRSSPSWIGVRAAASFGLSGSDLTSQGQLLVMARYHHLQPDSNWNYGVYLGAGAGSYYTAAARAPGSRGGGFAVTLGVEGGYKLLRASVEAMYLNGIVTFIPGLSLAFTF